MPRYDDDIRGIKEMTNRNRWKSFEPVPRRGTPLFVRDGIYRLVTDNPGPMTYHGTNTWLIKTPNGTVVIDPGSKKSEHIDAILLASNGNISHIFVTHWHIDHSEGAEELQAICKAPIVVHSSSPIHKQLDTIKIDHYTSVGNIIGIHTPGHTMDHMCYALPNKILFTGDHIMGWSTSFVPPSPEGSIELYLKSLSLVFHRKDSLLLPGHGPPLWEPQRTVNALLTRRSERLEDIFCLLGCRPMSAHDVASLAYPSAIKYQPNIALLSTLSHLAELERCGLATSTEEGWIRK